MKVVRWIRILWGHAVAVAVLMGMAIGNMHHLWRYLTSPIPRKRKRAS